MAGLSSILLLVSLLVVSHRLFLLIHFLGFHKTIQNHTPGPCRDVDGMGAQGSGDVSVLSNGLAFISSGMKVFVRLKPAMLERKAQISLFDFNKPFEPARPLSVEGDITLQSPHALTAWEDPHTGEVTLFVIDHREEDIESVEKFHFDPRRDTLRHITSITSEKFTFLGGIAAESADTFYVTNSLQAGGVTGLLEFFSMLQRGTVFYYDGSRIDKVAAELGIPSAVALSTDHRFLYVGCILTQNIYIYHIRDGNLLSLFQVIPVDLAVVSIEVSPTTGNLWVTGPPIVWQALYFLTAPTKTGPSQVLRVQVKDGQMIEKEAVLTDTGRKLKVASSAATYNGMMLIGTPFNNPFFCEAKHLA